MVRQVEVLQGVYGLTLVVLCLLIALVLMISGPSHYPIGRWAALGLCVEAVAMAYFGLRLRKSWVVSLIVFSSANAMIFHIGACPQTVGDHRQRCRGGVGAL